MSPSLLVFQLDLLTLISLNNNFLLSSCQNPDERKKGDKNVDITELPLVITVHSHW